MPRVPELAEELTELKFKSWFRDSEDCVRNVFLFVFFRVCLFVCLFVFSRAAPEAYGGSQARGQIGAVAASLRQSRSNSGSEPTPQFMATLDP